MKHEIEPVYDGNSRILILGSFPSEASRKQGFYYGHPRNRFWRVISGVLGCGTPETVDEKKRMLLSHGVALWDVVGSCTVKGSADSSIKDVLPNDLSVIFGAADSDSVSFSKGCSWLYLCLGSAVACSEHGLKARSRHH